MKIWRIWGFLLIASSLSAGPTLGGKIYFDYTYDLTDGQHTVKGFNSFNVTRFYFGVQGKHYFSNTQKGYAGYRILLDGKDMGNGYFTAYVKYAYFEIGGVLPYTTLRLGQVPTPWVGFEEKIWGFRFVQKVFVDQFNYFGSTDRGVTVSYTSPKKFAQVALALVNGEGYHAPEVNKYKDMMGRLSIFPLAGSQSLLSGLGLHAYGHLGTPDQNQKRNRYIVAVSEKSKAFHLMGEVVLAEDGPADTPVKGGGFSVHGSIDLGKLLFAQRPAPKSFGLFFKYDQLDPNKDAQNDGVTEWVAGIFVHPCLFEASIPNVTLALNVVNVSYEDPTLKNDTEVRLNGEIRF